MSDSEPVIMCPAKPDINIDAGSLSLARKKIAVFVKINGYNSLKWKVPLNGKKKRDTDQYDPVKNLECKVKNGENP